MQYNRLLLSAERLIKSSGILVDWVQVRAPVTDPLMPFQPTGAARETVTPVWVVIVPVGSDSSLKSFARDMAADVPEGSELVFLAGNAPFIPADGDIIRLPTDYVIDGVSNVATRGQQGTMKIGDCQQIRPAGFPILHIASAHT